MYSENINNIFNYFGTDYQFSLTDEKFHNYRTLIIKPNHIKLILNNTELSNADLKTKIIEDWFSQENEETRLANNKKRRETNGNSKEI